MKIMFSLCLFSGTWIAEAGKGQREAKGQGRRYDGRSHKDSHRSSYEYDYYDHGHDRRGSSHSRRRRRRRSIVTLGPLTVIDGDLLRSRPKTHLDMKNTSDKNKKRQLGRRDICKRKP